MPHARKLLTALIAGALASGSAFATNGYAPHGIGMKSKGMGGVNIGYQADAVAVGGNPAGSAWIGDRADLGVDLFRPIREATFVDNGALTPGGGSVTFDGSDSEWFFIPEFGYRRGLNNDLAFALSVFGNGGMNSDYAPPGIPLFNAGTGNRTGINLMQLFVVPSLSYKVNPNHSIGIGLNLVAQGFEARGLQSFTQLSTSPTNISENGTDWAYGAGVRVGWMGKLTSNVTVGATYQSRTYMTEFDDYSGLFAEQGDFDVPSNFGVGIAIQATPKLLIAADVMRIQYGEVDSIANPINNLFGCFGGDFSSCLGGNNGPGFGWDDMTVYKIGFEYQVDPKLTLRAGYNHGSAPIPSSQTLFNVLAPATVEDHLTLGLTYQVNPGMEVTAAYMHAFEVTINGSNSIPPAFGGGEADIQMYQDSFGVSVAWKL